MISSRALMDEIEVYRVGRDRTSTGFTPTLTLLDTVWGSLLELTVAAAQAYDKQDVQATHNLKVRGRQEYDFAVTRFKLDGRMFRPLGAARYPGGRRGNWTVMDVRDVTQDGQQAGGSSGS